MLSAIITVFLPNQGPHPPAPDLFDLILQKMKTDFILDAMANYTAASDRCPALSVSPGRSDLVFASLSFLSNVRNTDPGSDTLVLALLHKFPLQKVQINLSLTGSLTHSVTAVNG